MGPTRAIQEPGGVTVKKQISPVAAIVAIVVVIIVIAAIGFSAMSGKSDKANDDQDQEEQEQQEAEGEKATGNPEGDGEAGGTDEAAAPGTI